MRIFHQAEVLHCFKAFWDFRVASHLAKSALLGNHKSSNHLRLVNVGELTFREPSVLQVLRVAVRLLKGLLDFQPEPIATILSPLDEPCVPAGWISCDLNRDLGRRCLLSGFPCSFCIWVPAVINLLAKATCKLFLQILELARCEGGEAH